MKPLSVQPLTAEQQQFGQDHYKLVYSVYYQLLKKFDYLSFDEGALLSCLFIRFTLCCANWDIKQGAINYLVLSLYREGLVFFRALRKRTYPLGGDNLEIPVRQAVDVDGLGRLLASANLTASEQQLLVLRFQEDKSLVEVGNVLEITSEAVRLRLKCVLAKVLRAAQRRGLTSDSFFYKTYY